MEAQQGVVVITLTTIYETVKDVPALVEDMKNQKAEVKEVRLDIGKLKSQVAAQWVIVGIIIVALGSQASKMFGV